MPDQSYQGKLSLVPYDPRYRAIEPPTVGIFAEPTMSICFNVQWAAHLDGVISRLQWTDAWGGTAEQQQWAVREITKLLVSMIARNPCGDGDGMSCLDVANCIETDSGVADAITQLLLENEALRRVIDEAGRTGAPMSSTAAAAPLTSADCDLDVLFAQITGIVDQMHRNNEDFLEVLSLSALPGEKLSRVIAAIPVVETLPIDDVINWIAKMVEEIEINYDAQWTDSVRDEIRCALFCLARDKTNCELSYDDILNYFNSRLGAALDPFNLALSVIQYTALGTWSGTTVVDIMFLNQIGIWKAAGEWLGQSLRSLAMVTKLSGNTPDSDWTLLCTECPSDEWTHVFPDENGWAAWTLETFAGATTTESGGKLIGATNSTNDAVFLNFKITVDASVTNVGCTIEWSGPSSAPQAFNLYIDGVLVESLDLNALTSPATLSYPASESGNHEYEFLGGITGSTASGKFLRATSSTWSGTGANPFA